MIVQFKEDTLTDYFEGNYSGKQPFNEMVLKGFRKVIMKMIVANNLNDLKKIRGLNIEYFDEEWKARINNRYRIHFIVERNIIIINQISKHYE